jgi:TatD DNase family protein
MGLHPCSVQPDWDSVLSEMKALLDAPDHSYVAIGETGLDLYWDKSSLDRQTAALEVQVEWAKTYDLPIILHARDAIDETLEVMERLNDERLRGVFHCYDGDLVQAERIMALGGFWIGIGGIVTYRKDVQAVVKELPLESLVLETDSPYLPPEPHRKDKPRRNESSYTKYVGAKIAELKELPEATVAEATNANARQLFPRLQKLVAE